MYFVIDLLAFIAQFYYLFLFCCVCISVNLLIF